MDWLNQYEFSDVQMRSVVAGMKEMSAVDGDEDPQEIELIEQVCEGVQGPFELDFTVFDTPEAKEAFMRLVTFVAIVDTNINDDEWRLMESYVSSLELSEGVQHFVDGVGEPFLRTVFADSEILKIWVPRLKEALRLGDDVVERLLA